jgi:hypothetical protein
MPILCLGPHLPHMPPPGPTVQFRAWEAPPGGRPAPWAGAGPPPSAAPAAPAAELLLSYPHSGSAWVQAWRTPRADAPARHRCASLPCTGGACLPARAGRCSRGSARPSRRLAQPRRRLLRIPRQTIHRQSNRRHSPSPGPKARDYLARTATAEPHITRAFTGMHRSRGSLGVTLLRRASHAMRNQYGGGPTTHPPRFVQRTTFPMPYLARFTARYPCRPGRERSAWAWSGLAAASQSG